MIKNSSCVQFSDTSLLIKRLKCHSCKKVPLLSVGRWLLSQPCSYLKMKQCLYGQFYYWNSTTKYWNKMLTFFRTKSQMTVIFLHLVWGNTNGSYLVSYPCRVKPSHRAACKLYWRIYAPTWPSNRGYSILKPQIHLYPSISNKFSA